MRKSISVAFFSLVSTLMVLVIVLMGFSEWVLFSNYFASDRYETLDQVVGVTQRAAQYLVQEAELPEGDELDTLSTKLEIIGESAEAYLFFTDNDGSILIASNPEMLHGDTVDEAVLTKADSVDKNYHLFSTLDGVLAEKSYISVSEMRSERGGHSGYLFLCSSGEQLAEFKQQFWSNFLLSACVMLLCASVLTKLLMRRLTDPLQKVTDAAQRFGGGDLSVRVEGVEGEGEVADLARTFNRMAENIQSNDNSRGQFMGNIATDHAPHSEEDKLKGMAGMVGSETAFGVCYTKLCKEEGLPLELLVHLMSTRPAEILGLAKGQLEPGYDADFVLVDLDTPYTVDKDKLHSKSHNCPFDGAQLYGRVFATVKGGELTYQAEE